MTSREEVLRQLTDMSNRLGEEHRELVILGEGNTSAKVSDDTFFVKASGTQLGTITPEGFVEVRFARVFEMLDGPPFGDEETRKGLSEAMVAPGKLMPSIETLFHGYLLSLPGVRFVGHTHPVSVNAILCSKRWREVTSGRIFPDEIVCAGIAPAYVEYTDPGVELAGAIRRSVRDYIQQYGDRPRAILVQNHGLIALGATPKEVESITATWDKTAKVLAGTFQFGGPNYMSEEHVNRICTRPDEEQRRRLIEGRY